MKNLISAICIAFALGACTEKGSEGEQTTSPTNRVKLSSEIKWEQLNPARGDQSPKAGTIWGDRKGTEATGFLAKFVDGFSSPPHIHNVTYRALVIKGLIHNEDPSAAHMWMPPGSFWTQPAGEPHITSAKGEENIVYVEIDGGPYLVWPVKQAVDNGERPINVDVNNLVWLDAEKTNLITPNGSSTSPAMAFLWQDKQTSGHLVKLPAGFDGRILIDQGVLRAVVIIGNPVYHMTNREEGISLETGSYFTSQEASTHILENSTGSDVLIYIRAEGQIRIK
jgi:hypothetical protein